MRGNERGRAPCGTVAGEGRVAMATAGAPRPGPTPPTLHLLRITSLLRCPMVATPLRGIALWLPNKRNYFIYLQTPRHLPLIITITNNIYLGSFSRNLPKTFLKVKYTIFKNRPRWVYITICCSFYPYLSLLGHPLLIIISLIQIINPNQMNNRLKKSEFGRSVSLRKMCLSSYHSHTFNLPISLSTW